MCPNVALKSWGPESAAARPDGMPLTVCLMAETDHHTAVAAQVRQAHPLAQWAPAEAIAGVHLSNGITLEFACVLAVFADNNLTGVQRPEGCCHGGGWPRSAGGSE